MSCLSQFNSTTQLTTKHPAGPGDFLHENWPKLDPWWITVSLVPARRAGIGARREATICKHYLNRRADETGKTAVWWDPTGEPPILMILEGAYILRENYSSVATVSGVVVFVKGYRDDSLFRHYAAPPSVQLLPLTIQLWPPEVSDEQLKQQALETCIRDFVISPEWPGLSRGFLDGLPTLLNEAGPSSDLTGAARILTLAAVGNRMGRTSLVYSTAQQYGNLLLSFQASLTRPGIHKVHLLVTGVLLGLYEVSVGVNPTPLIRSWYGVIDREQQYIIPRTSRHSRAWSLRHVFKRAVAIWFLNGSDPFSAIWHIIAKAAARGVYSYTILRRDLRLDELNECRLPACFVSLFTKM